MAILFLSKNLQRFKMSKICIPIHSLEINIEYYLLTTFDVGHAMIPYFMYLNGTSHI